MEGRRDVFGLEDEAIDSDYLHFLYQGSEQLSAGELAGARESLEKAYRLKPTHQKTSSLLALTYFKLGVYDRALDLYKQLCDENPTDPTLRVNMGLVYLKTGSVDDAIRELDIAIDLAPSHQKALNYLGLAWAQKGELGRARDYFVSAKNDAMAQKMDRQLAEQDGAGGQTLRMQAAQRPAETQQPEQTAAEVALTVAEPTVTTAPMRVVQPPAASARALPPALAQVRETMPLAAFVQQVTIEPGQGAPYAVAGQVLAIDVEGEILTRLEGLLAVRGTLNFTPEMKRFRGKATDKAFGEKQRRMVRATGQGRLLVARGDRVFTALELADEAGYFREDAVYSFQERLSFENGRVPSKVSPDLHLVHLRGQGAFLLSTLGPVGAIEVPRGSVARVPFETLVGWHGSLAPKIVILAEEAGPDGAGLAGVELSGEGRVLLELPPPEPVAVG